MQCCTHKHMCNGAQFKNGHVVHKSSSLQSIAEDLQSQWVPCTLLKLCINNTCACESSIALGQ